MDLVHLAENKRYLTIASGDPMFMLGVNYHGYFDRAWKMWGSDWFEAELIERDLRKAKQSGFNTIRLMIDETLAQEISRNNFKKLDKVLQLAQAQKLWVMPTLNSSHALELAQVAEFAAKLTTHYKDNPTILGYDLENAPTFYHLAAAQYPTGYTATVQTTQLIDHYGPRVSREQVADLQQKGHLPSHLTADLAFYYANALHLFREYEIALKAFEAQGRGTAFDFLLSNEAAMWHPLIGVLESTLETWLKARLDPIRAGGCQHLATVSWNQLHLALLPSNNALDFQSYQHYTPLSLNGFNTIVSHLQSLRRAHPDHAILLSEFGWSNQPSAHDVTDYEQTALYEAAMFSFLRAHNFSGGYKWALNDWQEAADSTAAHFGVFRMGDEPKPISNLVQHFATNWPPLSEQQPHFFAAGHESRNGLAYRFDLPQQVTVGGHVYQDNAMSWQAHGPAAHCFIQRDLQQIVIEAHGAGRLTFDPWRLVPAWNQAHPTEVYRVYSPTSRTRHQEHAPGETVVLEVRPGAQYLIKMGLLPTPAEVDGAPHIEPKLGEHVVVLVDSDSYLNAAQNYIRRFAPDISFAPAEVAGRWAYVTVIAPPDQISDEVLEEIRAVGTSIVERVISESPESTETMLNELAQRGQRFLEIPVLALSSNGHNGHYVVQPGDSLAKIAQIVYGNPQLWQLLLEANQDQLPDPSRMPVGLALRLPKV